MSSAEHVNFWEKSLLDISTRTRQTDTTVLLVGNQGVGKTTLMADFCENIPNRPSSELVCYDYFNVNDTDDSEFASKVNIWSFDDKTFPTFVDMYLNEPSDDNKVAVVVVVDASADDSVASLAAWFQNIRHHQQQLSKDSQTNGTDSNTPPVVHFPLLVVGSKSDQIRVDNIDSLKRAKVIQGQLRSLCLKENAGLVYTSVAGNGQIVNGDIVKSLICRSLFADTNDMDRTSNVQMKEGTADAIIPSGCDTFELIHASTDVDAKEFLNSFPSAVAPKVLTEAPGKGKDNPVSVASEDSQLHQVALSLENEEKEWIQSLKKGSTDRSRQSDADSTTESSPPPTEGIDSAFNAGASKRASATHAVGSETVAGKGAPRRASTQATAVDTASGKTASADSAAPNDQAVRGFFENLLTSSAPKKG